MYKLVGVGGQIRGKQFALSEGENFFGSDANGDHQISFKGISKEHFKIIVSDDFLTILDLDSSNGTFVNKKLITQRAIREGDVIAIPNAIFQTVKIKTEKIKASAPSIEQEEIPQSLVGKGQYFFEKSIMPLLYSLNKSWEWKSMLNALVLLAVVFSVFISVDSVLNRAKTLVKTEVVSRAKQYLHEVNRRNANALKRKEYDQINITFLAQEKSISSYYLFDARGIILNSDSQKNVYISDSFSVAAKEAIQSKNDLDFHHVEFLGEGKIGVARGIFARNFQTQRDEIVGYVSIIFSPEGLIELESLDSIVYLESLIKSVVFALIILFLIYYLTKNHFKVLESEVKEMTNTGKRNIEKEELFSELIPIEKMLETYINRVQELSSDDGEGFSQSETEESYVEILLEFLKAYPGAGLVLNSEKYIKGINSNAEDVLGIRESLSLDQDLSDVIRNQATAAKIIQLCNETGDSSGLFSEDLGEISGVEYNIKANCLLGKDGFPKAYLIGLMKE